MKIEKVEINNFRLLKNTSLSLQEKTTVIVGRNNSDKTSLTEIFRRFSKRDRFKLEDFSLSSFPDFSRALKANLAQEKDSAIREILPSIDIILIVNYLENKDDYGVLSNFIIDLDENLTNTQIKISYRLQDGKIDSFFSGMTDEKAPDFFDIIRERIPMYYDFEVIAIDLKDPDNTAKTEFENYKRLIRTDFINAQRWLDDETIKENDVLGKVLSSIFSNASKESAPEEMQKKSKELDEVVKQIQTTVDSDFNTKVKALIPALNIMGYPGLSDPNFTTKTSFDAKTIIEKNTKLLYEKAHGITLPETYNGLGSRNLIFILFHLFDYFRQFQSDEIQPKNHVIFIEEPEAHLHPQMQEVFIRKLYEIADTFSTQLNGGKKWPVQFIVTSHSTHIANEAEFDSIRYFLTKGTEDLQTYIKDLNEEFSKPDNEKDKNFIHKYLTLTKCDLFFADKAILIEGPTERILMPEFIKKLTTANLNSQFISTVEIGGAYAHHFYKFLDFLELKTLIITDLDSTKHKQTDKGIKYEACQVSAGEKSSNTGIIKWFSYKDDEGNDKENVDLSEIRTKVLEDKIQGTRRIAYQIDEEVRECCGRSFEDAFIITNPTLFGIAETKGKALEAKAFEEAKKYTSKKTDFAIKYAYVESKWEIPLYIKEGLTWLSENESDKVLSTDVIK
ncbi:ATP-dependent nuclease [Echinicola rosea]|uniref:ATP-dependent endonuclease n=1 Tax=Echinicola rosea TaxID=1807691 RepID=A0ABQ1V941_9BACT|nr:ATP-dependent endonuclease [Echinicola rosea]GGF43112.1 ATP-dependent endonuclease [Echinicola rosea]